MTNLPIIKKNTEIQKINKNLSIVNRLLPTVELQSSFNKLAWWNTLSQGWKYVFWGELNISEIEFNKKPDFYLEKLFNTTTELWFDYDLVDFYKIQDISPLGNLTQLTSLDLEYNQIRDISPLVKLENLETLYLKGNPITQLDIDWLQSKLPNCKINSEDDDY
ncbi:leucine-rich repeat domain-containing protein [Glaesserella parasuis]|nr:leucine-rich repeat domain-containing protein [Glaesserella parasuis]